MTEICSKCGLPKEICTCSQIEKETQKIKVRIIKRKFGKVVTMITGIEGKENVHSIGRELKRKLACGGTIKKGVSELQGNHKAKIKDILIKFGYPGDLIDA